jgi:hypothetical protein
MTGVLRRLGAAFVAPADAVPAVAVAAPAVALLCRAQDAWVGGGAVALASGGGVVAAWGAAPPLGRAPAGPAARRLAAMLDARGHRATATGRLVHVVVDDPREAGRVAAAAGLPCVAVLAGPRDDEVDALLRDQDRILVAADDAVADLALAGVARFAPAHRLDLATAPAHTRALAAAGIVLAPPLAAAVKEALGR